MTETWHERPNRLPWPPIIYLAAVFAALGAWRVLPIGVGDSATAPVIGWLVLAGGLALDVAAMLTLRRHAANVLPHRAATALVTTGPYAVSRNPIYLGNTIALIGAAGAFGNIWFIPAALLAAAAVQEMAIRREEAHLAARFGEAWTDYALRTPRWFGF